MIEPSQKQTRIRNKVESSRWKITARRSVDLFAITICSVVLIRCGYVVSHWWDSEKENGLSSLAKPIVSQQNQPFPSISLDKNQSHVSNEIFVGNESEVIDELRERCRLQLPNKELPTEKIGRNEAELLDKLLGSKPIAEFNDIWKVYHLKEQLPSVVGIKKIPSKENHWRVVFWSMAIPLQESRWSLWFLNQKRTYTNSIENVHDFAFPPSIDHNITMNSNDGEILTFFSGNGEIENCIQKFDQHYQKLNWDKARDLKQNESRKLLRYLSPNANETVEIIFYRTKMNQFSGIQIVKQNGSESVKSNE